MPGQVADLEVRAREGAQVAGAFNVRAGTKRIDPLDVEAVSDPAFAAKQYPHPGDLALLGWRGGGVARIR
jgi:hypothetical protein